MSWREKALDCDRYAAQVAGPSASRGSAFALGAAHRSPTVSWALAPSLETLRMISLIKVTQILLDSFYHVGIEGVQAGLRFSSIFWSAMLSIILNSFKVTPISWWTM